MSNLPMDFPVPSSAAVKKDVKEHQESAPPRNYVDLPPNLADNQEIAEQFSKALHGYYTRYVDQAERTELETVLKDADAKYRLAPVRASRFRTGSAQKDDAESNVASGQFYESASLLTSAINSIIFPDDGTPSTEYEAVEHSPDYGNAEGERNAAGQNLYYKWWWAEGGGSDIEGVPDILREVVRLATKNTMAIFTVEWDYRVDTRPERLPGYYDSNGNPQEGEIPTGEKGYDKDGQQIPFVLAEDGTPHSYVFVDKTRVVKNAPVVEIADLKRTYWDLTMPVNQQACIVTRTQKTLAELLAKERAGEYVNVGKLSEAQMFRNRTANGEETDTNQQDNADQDYTDGQLDGRFDVYHAYILGTVDESGKKAKWDKNVIPTIHEVVFAGPLGSFRKDDKDEKPGGQIALQIRKNPYHHCHMPHIFVYSHPDEKTGVKMGNINLLTCNVEEQDQAMNDHFDCRRLKVRRPMLANAKTMLERSVKFRRGNQLIFVKRGPLKDAMQQLEIDDITGTTMPTLDYLENKAKNITRTTDVVAGEYAGSRTTGTEVVSARSQAMKPIVEQAAFVARFLPQLARSVADLCRQFADPAMPIYYKGESVNPAELYGEYNVKVTSIERFEASVQAQQAIANFLQVGGYDRSRHLMTDEGEVEFWRTYGKAYKFLNADKIWAGARPYVEAESQALGDWNAILTDPQKAMMDPEQLPKEGERHEIHIRTLTQKKNLFVKQSVSFDNEQQEWARLVLAVVDMYIQIHEQMQEAAAGASQAQNALLGQNATVENQASPGQAPGLAGEAVGDNLAGQAGGV